MRVLMAVLLGVFMAACSVQSYDPAAQVDIRATPADMAKVIQATKAFGEREGFKVSAGDSLVKEGRQVSQVDLQRDDGVMITLDNFMQAGTLQVFFFEKQPTSDWRSVKEAWLQDMRIVLEGRGEIVEVPVGPLR